MTLSELRKGDTVQVTMRSGATHRLKLTSVAPDRLTGRKLDAERGATSLELATAYISSLEVSRITGWKTVGMAAAIAAGAVVAMGLGRAFKCNYIGGGGRKCDD